MKCKNIVQAFEWAAEYMEKHQENLYPLAFISGSLQRFADEGDKDAKKILKAIERMNAVGGVV